MFSPHIFFLGTWAVLFARVQGVQGVTASQVQTRAKHASAVVNAGAEALVINEEPPRPGTASPPSKTLKPYTGRKVNIDVYYETKCPGCLFFLNRTLEPLWRKPEFRDFLNITMYTYGNGMTIPLANVSEGFKFWHPDTTGEGWKSAQICQHGSDECLGNLVTLCAKEVADNAKYMELIFCMASTTLQGYSEEKATFECMQKHSIDRHKVRECVNSPRGNQLVTAAGLQTHALKGRLGTPWVMIDDEHLENHAIMNVTLLMQSVCSKAANLPVPCAPFEHQPKHRTPSHSHEPSAADDFQVFGKDMELPKLSQI